MVPKGGVLTLTAVENLVLRGATNEKPAAVTDQKMVEWRWSTVDASLSTTNVFSCNSIHDLNGSPAPSDQVHMNTESEGMLSIITDIQVRANPRAKTQIMTATVDPGTEPA